MKKTLILFVLGCAIGSASGPCDHAGPYARIGRAPFGETDIRIEGQVVLPDGKTPAASVVMYVYHTGSDGKYGKNSAGGPLYQAWLRTGPDGRYRYETIRPAPYSDGQTPAHIHIQFWGGDVPAQYSDDLYFDDDILLSKATREASVRMGRFANVVRLTRRDGVLGVTQDFRLKTTADRFEESIMHGVRQCQ